jgi:hypothetical protein
VIREKPEVVSVTTKMRERQSRWLSQTESKNCMKDLLTDGKEDKIDRKELEGDYSIGCVLSKLSSKSLFR